ncbi:MAG: hypothetical protein JWO84_270 [Parcubacteria group bacterium]|nr:hypothetical protein [Parcubacteria group bacterium]
MNKTSLITSGAGIALLLASAAPALAQDGGAQHADESVSTSVSVTTNGQTTSEEVHQGGGLRTGVPKLHPMPMASTTMHMENKDNSKSGDHMNNGTSTQVRMAKVDDKAAQAIDVRIKSLQELSARLATLKMLPASTLASIQTTLAAEIQTLIDLKAKIASDMSTTTIKADVDSITKANRVFLLVEPKARIASAASRVNAVVLQMQTLATKLQTRITAAQTAGVNVSAAVTALADFNAKTADAKVNADAAVSETVNLQADNGNQTVLAANKVALKDAEAKLKTAQKDLKAARDDAKTIADVVRGKGDVKVTATTTAETH